MSIMCNICYDKFVQSDNISVTRCGHIFHLKCLSQWLDTGSNSCPECRKKTSQEQIQKLYVTFETNEPNSADKLSMQERIDSLKFQVLLNEKNIKYYTSKNETLEKQNAGLRQEVRKVESEINKKSSKIYLLKEQIKNLKEKLMEHEILKRRLSQKEKEIEDLQNLKKLLYGSVTDAEKMVEKTDRDTLVTYIKVMKRDMSRNAKRCELLYKHVKRSVIMLKEITTIRDQSMRPETTYDKKHLENVRCVLGRLCEIENLTMVIFKSCHYMKTSIPNNSKKSNKHSYDEMHETKVPPSQTYVRQGTQNLSSPSLNLENMTASTSLCSVISRMTNTNQEIESSDNMFLDIVTKKTNQDKCPISKKRAKLL